MESRKGCRGDNWFLCRVKEGKREILSFYDFEENKKVENDGGEERIEKRMDENVGDTFIIIFSICTC